MYKISRQSYAIGWSIHHQSYMFIIFTRSIWSLVIQLKYLFIQYYNLKIHTTMQNRRHIMKNAYLSSSSHIFESFNSDAEINFRIFASDSSILSTLKRKVQIITKLVFVLFILFNFLKQIEDHSNLFSSSPIFSSFSFKACRNFFVLASFSESLWKTSFLKRFKIEEESFCVRYSTWF